MNCSLLIQDSVTGTRYDAAELLVQATWSGAVSGQVGTLQLELVGDRSLSFQEGSPLQLTVSGQQMFSGWVFSRSRGDGKTLRVTAYDQTRYLKNTDTYVFSDVTASELFSKLCTDFQLKHKVTHPSSYKLPDKIYDGRTLADMIEDSIHITRQDTGSRYFFRDSFGTLEFLQIGQLRTELVLGDSSLMTGCSYLTSIDSDTYNQVKLMRDSGQGGRVFRQKNDPGTIARWGTLQHFEQVEEGLNEAQMDTRAAELLKQKNRVEKSLSMQCLGDWRAVPGTFVWVQMNLEDGPLSGWMLVESCTHTLRSDLHTMQLNLELEET